MQVRGEHHLVDPDYLTKIRLKGTVPTAVDNLFEITLIENFLEIFMSLLVSINQEKSLS